MNVIGSRPDGWWKDRRGATVRLLGHLERWAAGGSDRVTVVLEQPLTPPLHSGVVEIAAAPQPAPDSADDEIVRMVGADPHPQDITVVTSDGALARRVTELGAAAHPARAFRRLIEQTGEQQ